MGIKSNGDKRSYKLEWWKGSSKDQEKWRVAVNQPKGQLSLPFHLLKKQTWAANLIHQQLSLCPQLPHLPWAHPQMVLGMLDSIFQLRIFYESMIYSAFLNPMVFGRKSMTTGVWKVEIWFVKYFHVMTRGFVLIRNSPLPLSQYPTHKNAEQNISLE